MQTATLGRVIVGVARRADIAHREVFLALVDEARRQHRAILQILAVLQHFAVGHREAVTGPDVEHEIDVVTEDVGKAQRRLIMAAGAGHRFEERGVDAAADGAGAGGQSGSAAHWP